MKLVSMKQSPKEVKEQSEPVKDEGPRYPYGLCLTLNEEALTKLGIKELPKVGESFTIAAKGTITMARSMETQGHNSKGVDLQITDLGVSSGEKKSDSETLYPEGGNTKLKG